MRSNFSNSFFTVPLLQYLQMIPLLLTLSFFCFTDAASVADTGQVLHIFSEACPKGIRCITTRHFVFCENTQSYVAYGKWILTCKRDFHCDEYDPGNGCVDQKFLNDSSKSEKPKLILKLTVNSCKNNSASCESRQPETPEPTETEPTEPSKSTPKPDVDSSIDSCIDTESCSVSSESIESIEKIETPKSTETPKPTKATTEPTIDSSIDSCINTKSCSVSSESIDSIESTETESTETESTETEPTETPKPTETPEPTRVTPEPDSSIYSCKDTESCSVSSESIDSTESTETESTETVSTETEPTETKPTETEPTETSEPTETPKPPKATPEPEVDSSIDSCIDTESCSVSSESIDSTESTETETEPTETPKLPKVTPEPEVDSSIDSCIDTESCSVSSESIDSTESTETEPTETEPTETPEPTETKPTEPSKSTPKPDVDSSIDSCIDTESCSVSSESIDSTESTETSETEPTETESTETESTETEPTKTESTETPEPTRATPEPDSSIDSCMDTESCSESLESLESAEETETPEPTRATPAPDVDSSTDSCIDTESCSESPESLESSEETKTPEPTRATQEPDVDSSTDSCIDTESCSESPESLESTEETETPKPIETEPTETEPTETEPTKKPESTEASEPTKIEPTETEPTETESTETSEPTETLEPTEAPGPTKTETTDTPEPTITPESTETQESTKTKPTEAPELTETAESTETSEPTETERTETEPTKTPEPQYTTDDFPESPITQETLRTDDPLTRFPTKSTTEPASTIFIPSGTSLSPSPTTTPTKKQKGPEIHPGHIFVVFKQYRGSRINQVLTVKIDIERTSLYDVARAYPQVDFDEIHIGRQEQLRTLANHHVGPFDGSREFKLSVTQSIETLKRGLFRNISGIKQFSLSDAPIAIIDKKVFSGQPIEVLRLADNKISTIHPNAFDKMKNLRTIDLNNNQITAYDSSWFFGCSYLNWIYISNNLIQELPDMVFKNLNHHQPWIMRLDYNQITNVSNYIFLKREENLENPDYFKSLRIHSLSLKGNEITCLDDLDKIFIPHFVFLNENFLMKCSCVQDIREWSLRNPNKKITVSAACSDD